MKKEGKIMKKVFWGIALIAVAILPLATWAQEAKQGGSPLKFSVSNLEAELSGGVSGGYFYTNNAGQEHGKNRESKFVLSNVLFDLNLESKDYPVSLDVGLGGVVTPSLVDNPDDSAPSWGVEYADFSISPVENLTLEGGLLAPVAGYEDTYTYNNKNITVGVLASQQPYNAYGVRTTYSIKRLGILNEVDVYGAYYRNRKDEEEYCTSTTCPHDAWEAGISINLLDTDITLYHYHINGLRSLTGVVAEKEIGILYLGFNMDYWKWSNALRKREGINGVHSIGAALYVSAKVTKAIEFPLRLEYISQNKSRIYVDSEGAGDIYAITFTPTVYPTENTYVRVEGGYVHANNGFEDNYGNVKDSKYYLCAELGFKF
jgi:hypothetical protein